MTNADEPLGITHEARREAARRAWRADAPGDAETAAAVRRISARLGGAPRRRPRVVLLAFAALVLLATLAYAAGRGAGERAARAVGPASPSTSATRGEEPTAHRARAAFAPPARDPDEGDAPSALASSVEGSGTNVGASPASRARPGRSSPPARSGPDGVAAPVAESDERAAWRSVTRALEAEDEVAARHALERLDVDGNPDTRAKARLGMAQLALARGERAVARTLAGEVAATPGVSQALIARAQRLAARAAE